MKKIMWMFFHVLAIGLSIGSCTSCAVGHFRDIEGDGIEVSQTLTATILGFQRGSECEYTGESHDPWDCELFASRICPLLSETWYNTQSYQAEVSKTRPIAVFVAKWMLMPLEWFICFLLLCVSFGKVAMVLQNPKTTPNKPPDH